MKPIKLNFENIFIRLINSWLIVCILNAFTTSEDLFSIDSINSFNLINIIVLTILFFTLFSIINFGLRTKKIVGYYSYNKHASIVDYGCLLFIVPIFSINVIMNEKKVYVAAVLALISAWVVWYIYNKFTNFFSEISLKKSTFIALIVILVAIIASYMLTLLVLRYFVFRTATYDFGIFSQMYYNMKKSFFPMTTCERNRLLSHFDVHMSPIFYLILPIYCIFPHPVTLIVVQYLAILSGIIPLIMICKKRGLSRYITLCLCIIFVSLPTLTSGLFYDFHENKFLVPLLMWLIYFIEVKKPIGIFAFSALTLMVKEDAAIYVACIGLFLIFGKKSKREKLTGLSMLLVSVLYFFIIFFFLNTSGEGAMINRYGNFVKTDGSTVDILTSIIKNPVYFISQLLDDKKIETLLWFYVPVLFLPFMSKKVSTFILLIPSLVMTFMTCNVYQSSIDYQYTFGSSVLVIYIIIMYISGEAGPTRENDRESKLASNALVSMMVVASVIMFVSIISTKSFYIDEYKMNKEQFDKIEEVLDFIPEDASVLSSSFYLTHLTHRENLYRYPYTETDNMTFEYIVYDLRYTDTDEAYAKDKDELLLNGYEECALIEGQIAVFRLTNRNLYNNKLKFIK